MSPAQEHLCDESLLRVLDEEDSEFGLDANALTLRLQQQYGFPKITPDQVSKRLRYLGDDQIGFIVRVKPTGEFHAENDFWRIAPRGLNHLRRRRR